MTEIEHQESNPILEPGLRYFTKDEKEFMVDDSKFKRQDKGIGFVTGDNEGEYNENDRVVCDKCTKTFFQVFFNEYSMNNAEENIDPVLNDILKQKVFMKLDKHNKIFRCTNNPNHTETFKDTIISNPVKKLRPAGVDMYPMYDRNYKDDDTGEGSFIASVSRGKKIKNLF